MKKIKLLDCTLRDGGYINNWKFGEKNINKIIDNLQCSNIDYIEIGYLNENVQTSNDSTQFNNIFNLSNLNNINNNFLCMIDYGKYDALNLINKNQTKIDGIRVAFHKKDMVEALNFCKVVKSKGYKVFVQPMVTMNYNKHELEKLIELVNDLNPYSLYIVDSFGYMNNIDIKEKAKFIDSKLNENIILGFHSHNNLQLAYSNALTFIEVVKNREILIDSSIYGMGRGAGNLNTELIINYINENYGSNYKLLPILEISEEILSKIKAQNYWGYSLEYYLSAIYHLHPNYSKYLVDKKTLSLLDVEKVLNMIDINKASNFDREYISELYENFISNNIDDSNSYELLKNILKNKKVLIIGSGNSIIKYRNKIEKLNKSDNFVTIFVNHYNDYYNDDLIFINNRKRSENILKEVKTKKIITSNIKKVEKSEDYIIFDYMNTLIDDNVVGDNGLLVILNILSKIGFHKVYLAGFDGFDNNFENNHYNENLSYVMDKRNINLINKHIAKKINEFKEKIEIEWVTPSKYEGGF